ncbi:MAG: gliding motility-associated C-terminal domain-containing protein [Cyclobacteriaceae bacterium]
MTKALLFVTLICLVCTQVYGQASKPYRDCYADEVIFARQGVGKTGIPVDPNRSDPTLALGEPYKDINGNFADAFDSFYSLGFGGEIILRTSPIANKAGADIYINEATFQRDCDIHPENIKVYASQDNINYIYLGEGCQDSEFDLTGVDGTLAWAQYFRILDVSNPAAFPEEKNIDGYDVDGLVCLSEAPDAATYAIQPILTCVFDNGNGTFTASFGYTSPNNAEVNIPAGADNRLAPTGLTATLPETFQPGIQEAVFTVDFASGTTVTWTVGGRSAVASSSSAICNANAATATISGEDIFCPDERNEGTVTVQFTGTAPWDIVIEREYNGTTEEITVEDIATSLYTLTTDETGIYTLTSVSNANGEGTVSGFATISTYNKPSATLTGGQAIYCGAASDFEVIFSGAPPFSFTYSDGSTETTVDNINQQSYSFSVTDPGTYSLVSMEDANCSGTATGQANVEVLDPTATISGNNTIFCDETATISISLTGVQPYTFTYTDGTDNTTVNDIEEDTYTFDVTTGGTYSLVSFDAAGCAGTVSGSAEITTTGPSATIVVDTDICTGASGSFTVELAGRAPYSFTYSDGSNETTINNVMGTVYKVEGLSEGTYTLISVNDTGCPGTVGGTATIETVTPTATITAPDEVCDSDTVTLEVSTNIQATAYTWITDGTGSLSATNTASVTYTPGTNETGTVSFTVEVSTECGTVTADADVDIIETPSAAFTTSGTTVLTGEEVVFTSEDDGAESYQYDYGDGTSGSTGSHIYDAAGVYQVRLIASNGNCQSTSSLVITVEPAEGLLYVPNVFSPSSANAENQVVKVYGSGISGQDFSFEIYNRWGDLLWSTSSFSDANTTGWDGTVSGRLQPNGVYTYVLRGMMEGGRSFEKTGTISLVQ